MTDHDPLGDGDKAPALSFKSSTVGDVKYIDVTEPGKVVQSRNFTTGEPDFWKNQDGSLNPKMAVVFNGLDEAGQPASLWATIMKTVPGCMFVALREAQAALGSQIGTGPNVHRIHIKLDGTQPATNPRNEDRKLYKARVQVMGAKPTEPAPDPMGDDPWASPSNAGDEPPF